MQPGAAPPGVSVVVAHYGDETSTRQVVADLLEQTTDRTLQLVVVDDASPAPLGRLAPGVRVLRRERNGGYGAAVNSGAAVATQPLLLILNSDLRLGPTFVDDLARAATAYLPCVAGPATDEGGGFLVTGRRFPRTWRHVVEGLEPLRHHAGRPVYERLIGRDVRCAPGRTVTDVDWLQGSALLVPLDVFRAVHGFDERFYMYAEEVDLQRRLSQLDVPRVFLGTVRVDHEGGVSVDTSRRTEWLVRSQLTYADEWGFERRLRVALTAVACVNLVWNGLRRLGGRPAQPRSAWRREIRLSRLPTWPEPPGCGLPARR